MATLIIDLNMAMVINHQAKDKINIPFIIYKKNPEIGGLENIADDFFPTDLDTKESVDGNIIGNNILNADENENVRDILNMNKKSEIVEISEYVDDNSEAAPITLDNFVNVAQNAQKTIPPRNRRGTFGALPGAGCPEGWEIVKFRDHKVCVTDAAAKAYRYHRV